jgi:hypothetical protein
VLTFSPDGRRLATSGYLFDPNGPKNFVDVWDVATGEKLVTAQAIVDTRRIEV